MHFFSNKFIAGLNFYHLILPVDFTSKATSKMGTMKENSYFTFCTASSILVLNFSIPGARNLFISSPPAYLYNCK